MRLNYSTFCFSVEMQICISLSSLEDNTRVEVTSRNAHAINCTILDRCAVPGVVRGQHKVPLVKLYLETTRSLAFLADNAVCTKINASIK